LIKDEDKKITQIISTVETRIAEINDRYRKGPDLYFYRKIFHLRTTTKDIKTFLKNYENIEVLYTALLSWDMNCRGAKMKYFDDFKLNIEECLEYFIKIEDFEKKDRNKLNEINPILIDAYKKLDVMQTYKKIVSNSKILHFLFPALLMPIDGENVLDYFYGNAGESYSKYLEVINFQFEVMNRLKNPESYLDEKWNTTIPKMIDNAIILIQGKSIKK
jgi:hypothetical protein